MTRRDRSLRPAKSDPLDRIAADPYRARPQRRTRQPSNLAAQVQALDRAARGVQQLSQSIAEANERQSRALAELGGAYMRQSSEREESILQTVGALTALMRAQRGSSDEARAQQLQQIEHCIDAARAHQDWAGVAQEVIAQGGVFLQRLMHASRGGVAPGGESRNTQPIDLALPQHEPPPSVMIPPSVCFEPTRSPQPSQADAADPPVSVGCLDSQADSDFIAQFFGFSESAPPRAESVPISAEPPIETPISQGDHLPDEALAALRAVAERFSAHGSPHGAQGGGSPAVSDGQAGSAGALGEGGEALDPAALMDLLSQLIAQQTPKREPPRPREWSREWALQELKRRVLGMGEMGFLMTLTQPARLLPFLRELTEAIRPPPEPAPA